MTQTFSLAPVPFWYFPDASGKPLGSGKMFTYNSLNPTEYKPVFSDPSGTLPYSQPVLFNLNGTAGPFYWEFDSTKPDEFYFIQIFDSNDNLVYQINNFPGPSASGGGTITTNINLKNFLVNNSFLYNNSSIGPSIPDQTVIAPGSHSQLITPDIIFFNSNPGAIDSIKFDQFNLGVNPLTGDFIPIYYLNYSSNAFPDITKGIQFPINPNVNTLSNQKMTFSFWAQSVGGGANTIQIWINQFFGSGAGASPNNMVQFGSDITLTNSWARYTLSDTIANVAAFALGNTGDDSTYLQIRFPTNSSCDINIAKPSLYAGSSFPQSDFDTDEQIESLIETPRTGDIKIGAFNPSYTPRGWIYMTDTTTIGNSLSGATYSNINTWFLFNKLYNSFSDSVCPVSGGRTTVTNDWGLNKTLTLPPTLNRVMANASSADGHPLGTNIGSDNVTLTSAQLPDHSHIGPGGLLNFLTNAPGNALAGSGIGGQSFTTGTVSGVHGQAHPNIQPTIYLTYLIKL